MKPVLVSYHYLPVIILLLCLSVLNAQDYDAVKPRAAPALPAGTMMTDLVERPEPPEGKVPEGRLLIKGLKLVGDADKFVREGVTQEGLSVEDLPLLDNPEFRARLEPYLGRELSMTNIDKVTREIILYYRLRERPVVDAIVPDQKVETGVVQVVVLEGRLGKLITEGNSYTPDWLLAQYIRAKPGEVLDGARMLEDLDWMNENPFRQTDLVFARGEDLGDTELILRTTEKLPVRLYGGYENTGNHLTGKDRYFMGFNTGRTLWWDHLFSYQFTRARKLDLFQAHSFSYSLPLEWRHRLIFFGSYAETSATLPPPLSLEGESWRISSRYLIPLPDLEDYEHELTLGVDRSRSDNALEFGSVRVSGVETEVLQSVLSYSASYPDAWGKTSASSTLVFSPGNLTSRNSDKRFRQSRALSSSDYLYGKLSLRRIVYLPYNFLFIWDGKGQISSDNVLSSEQLGLGGRASIRGYEENEANADNGFSMRTELRGPVFDILPETVPYLASDALVLLFFWDYGTGWNHELQTGEDPHVDMSSIGPGLRYEAGGYLTVEMDWGFQLRDSGRSPTGANDRFSISVTASF